MLKKLLAASFAATLVLSTQARAADDYVWNGTAWEDAWSSGSGANIDGQAVTFTGGGPNYSIGNSDSDPVTTTPTSVEMDDASGTLHIGSDSTYAAAGGAVTVETGDFVVTAGNVVLYTGSTVKADDLQLAASTSIFTNNGTLEVDDISVTAGGIVNAGTLTLTDGSKAGSLVTALDNGGDIGLGTVNIGAGIGATGFDITGTAIANGTVNILDQGSSIVNGNVKVGAGVGLSLNGGTFNGALDADTLTFGGGRTVVGGNLSGVATGIDIKSGATYVVNDDTFLSTKTVANAGTIEIAASKTLDIGDGYASTSGAIDNTKGGTLGIDTATDTTAAKANEIFGDLVRGGSGNVGTVLLRDALADDWSTTGVTGGSVELTATQTAEVDVKVGGANLKIAGPGANTFKAITANEVTVDAAAAGGTTFKGVMTATKLIANENATFDTVSATYTGKIQIANGKSVGVSDGASVTVTDELTFGNTSSTLQNLGGILTISDKVDTSKGFAPDAGSIVINHADAVTNLNGSSASLLMAVENAANDLGTINVNGDAGNQAFDLGLATDGAIVFTGDQAANTNAVTFGSNVDVTFLSGDSEYRNGFTAASLTIGDTAGAKAASATFGGDVTGDVIVNTKSTFGTTGDAGATIKTGIDVKAGGVIAIGAQTTDDTKASTLNADAGADVKVSDEAKLKVASTVTSGDVFDTTFSGKLESYMGGDAALKEWLADQQMVTVSNTGNFTYESGKVSYNGTRNNTLAGQYAALKGIMGNFGSADFYPLVNNNLVTGLVDALDVTQAQYDALDARSQNMVDLLQALGGDTTKVDLTGRSRESYAGYRFATGQDLANALEAVGDTVRSFNKAMTGRGMAVTGTSGSFGSSDAYGAPLTMCESYPSRIWAGYTGLWGDAAARRGDRGYEYSANGFNVGFDRTFGGVFTVGTAFGYSKGDYTLKGGLGSDSDINNYLLGLYGTWNHQSGLFANIAGTYAYSDYDMASEYRANTWDRADYHGNTWSIGGDLGFAIRPVQNFTITPSVGLYYYTSNTSTFSTTAGRHDMKYKRHNLELPVQLTMKYDVCLGAESTLSLTADGGYTYNFRDKGTSIDEFAMANTGIVMGGGHGRDPGHSGWNVGGGLQYRVRNFDVGAHYEYYGRNDYESHKVWANVGLSF